MISIQQLLTVVTADQFRANMVTTLKTLGIPADQWKAGGIASSMLTVTANMLGQLSANLATVLQGFFLPTAVGDGLKLLAFYMYGLTEGVDYPAATFASGNLTLTNMGGGVYNIGIAQLTAVNTLTGQTYTNTAAFTLNALSTLSVPFAATTQGSVGNAIPNSITKLQTVLLGVTCTNPTSFVGLDPISDNALRQLCLNSLGVRSVRGPRTAYAYAIQTATNPVTNSPVNINRWTVSEASHTGTVTIYISGPSGSTDPNDLQGVINNIEAVARPDAVTVNVNAAAALAYSAGLTVYATALAGTSTVTVLAAINAQLNTFFSTYPIGGIVASDDTVGNVSGLFASGVVGAISLGCQNATASLISVAGAVDLLLSPAQVPINSTTVTLNLTIVPAAGV